VLKPKPALVVSRVKRPFGVSIDGFGSVADYRLYGLDGVNKVASGEWFEADDDETAIELARQMMDGHDCELWQGRRFVARVERGSGR
jgi:hypothetical protein